MCTRAASSVLNNLGYLQRVPRVNLEIPWYVRVLRRRVSMCTFEHPSSTFVAVSGEIALEALGHDLEGNLPRFLFFRILGPLLEENRMAILKHSRQFYALCCLAMLVDKALRIDWLPIALVTTLCFLAVDLLRSGEEFSVIKDEIVDQEDAEETTSEVRPGTETVAAEVYDSPILKEVPTPPPLQDANTTSQLKEQEALLDTLKTLYDEDRPFEAVHELQRLRANSLISEEHRFSNELRNIIAEIDEARAEIFNLTDSLEKESNWKLRMSHKKCDIFASTTDARDFKVVCECPDSNVFNLLSLIIETQYYKHWVPGVSESGRWDHSMFFQNLYLRFKLPFPLKDREVLLKGYGDVWKGNKVMIYIASIESKEAERKLNVRPGASRAEVVFSGILLKPLPNGGTELTLIARLDLKLAYLPDTIFDYAAKFILAELCSFLRDRSKTMTNDATHKDNKLWMDRQNGTEAYVYNEIRERLSKMQLD